MLKAEGLAHGYPTPQGYLPVLRGVDLDLGKGERVGLAGPSGSGKSTLARVLALLEQPSQGGIWLDGEPVRAAGTRLPPQLRRRVHLIWQAPRQVVDPRHRLRRVIAEPLRLHGELPRQRPAREQVLGEVAGRVGLTPDLLHRLPNEVSDGQLQRACIARALLSGPDVLVADEPGAMLDVSTQAAMLAVLQEEVSRGLAVLLISHDMALLDHWCDRILHLEEGQIRGPGPLPRPATSGSGCAAPTGNGRS